MVYGQSQLGQPGGYPGMNFLEKTKEEWKEDALLQKVIKNSGYLLSGNVFAMILSVVQSIFAGRLLGVVGFGIIGTVTVFASTINRLLSFRMNELVVKYYGESMNNHQTQRAAAVIKAAALAEGTSAVLSFIILVIFAPLAAARLADNAALAPYFILYGTIILANLVYESSTGILQVNNKFRSQAVINIAASLLTAGIITWAFFAHRGILEVLIAYLAGKFLLGIGTIILGFKDLNRTLGSGWWKTTFSYLPPFKELAKFAFSTNLSSTIIMLVRDNEILWVAYFLTPLEVGYAKTALAIINLVQIPINPLISTTYPEINRAVASKNWGQLRSLLRKVTFISGGWTILTGIGLAVFGRWLLGFYGPDFIPAYTPMLIFLVGLGFANIFFWNRPLLLSLGLPMVPYQISLWSGVTKIALAFLLVTKLGINFEAFLLSAFFVVSVGLIIRRGFAEIRKREALSTGSGE
jgi:O-antigen/teichoic acid export membrane protein